ncbi:unnamed protein product [Phytophthora fragariaefolia]|uniref:beta-ketoacyl-[acyl-carrier-protein] synthase I n=1 Tax=Phytophthora fragariaefolia TaxID=1490495 RepID=A0A9W6XXL3_9STRA|nr:unnamed protein product [Phytophthora fragariaefolia]
MLRRATSSCAARGFSTLSFGAPPPAPSRRVVVTGLGAVTPFGVGVSRSWDALLDSQCAIRTVDALADTGLNCTIGAAVPKGDGEGAFRTKDWVNLKNLRSQEPDFIAYTLAAGSMCSEIVGGIGTEAKLSVYDGYDCLLGQLMKLSRIRDGAPNRMRNASER